jgi:aldehyde dehydrogenase (NAD+)
LATLELYVLSIVQVQAKIKWKGKGEIYTIISPVNGTRIGDINLIENSDYNKIILEAKKVFPIWKAMPAPERGEIVRQFGKA